MPEMDSAPPLSSPAGFSLVSPDPFSSSSSYSADTEDEDGNQGFDRRFNHWFAGNFNRTDFPARLNPFVGWGEETAHCFGAVLVIWFFVSIAMIVSVYGPTNVWIGPNSSILVELNPIFVHSVKVKDLDDSKIGLQLFAFYRSPHLDVIKNWSESRLVSVSHKSYLGWPYYLNEGASLNISYSVKPEGRSVRLVVDKGTETRWLMEKSVYDNTALSWNLVRGSGMIQVNISKSSKYYVAVANLNMKDVKVELDIDVKAVLYDTKQSFYKCTFSNGECMFNPISLSGTSIVLTSPAPRQEASDEDDEWYIRFSYEPRLIAYITATGLLICFMLVAIQFWNKLQCLGEESYIADSARTRLLANKDEDGSSMDESFAADDADLEELGGDEGNGNRRLCAICFDSQRDCFFLPCGHCVSCYQCGTKVAEACGDCPICRRKIKKVKRIYTV